MWACIFGKEGRDLGDPLQSLQIWEEGCSIWAILKSSTFDAGKKDSLCGTIMCWIWPSWMGRLPALLRACSVEEKLESREEKIEEFYCLTLLFFFLTIEHSKGFSNAQRAPASSALQTMLCVQHFLVCTESEVKYFTLFLGEMAFKYTSKQCFQGCFCLDWSGWSAPSLHWQRRDCVAVTWLNLSYRGCLCEITLRGSLCRLLYKET